MRLSLIQRAQKDAAANLYGDDVAISSLCSQSMSKVLEAESSAFWVIKGITIGVLCEFR